jgi:hypothetical protein
MVTQIDAETFATVYFLLAGFVSAGNEKHMLSDCKAFRDHR